MHIILSLNVFDLEGKTMLDMFIVIAYLIAIIAGLIALWSLYDSHKHKGEE